VFDELENKIPLTHQWLLQSKSKMFINDNDVEIKNEKANLLVKFIFPEKKELVFTQTDEFEAPVDSAYESKYPSEWHFKANANIPKTKREFLTLLIPYKNGASRDYSVNNLKSKNGFACSIKQQNEEDFVLISKDKEQKVNCKLGSLAGNSFIYSNLSGKDLFSFIDLKTVSFKDFQINSNNLISGEGENSNKSLKLSFETGEKTIVKIRVNSKPNRVEGIDQEKVNFDEKSSMISFSFEKKVNLTVFY